MKHSSLDIPCPKCNAEPGFKCYDLNISGGRLWRGHFERARQFKELLRVAERQHQLDLLHEWLATYGDIFSMEGK